MIFPLTGGLNNVLLAVELDGGFKCNGIVLGIASAAVVVATTTTIVSVRRRVIPLASDLRAISIKTYIYRCVRTSAPAALLECLERTRRGATR